jgi:hypothetical protein
MTTTCTITNLGDVFITRFLDGKFFNRQWYCGVVSAAGGYGWGQRGSLVCACHTGPEASLIGGGGC